MLTRHELYKIGKNGNLGLRGHELPSHESGELGCAVKRVGKVSIELMD